MSLHYSLTQRVIVGGGDTLKMKNNINILMMVYFAHILVIVNGFKIVYDSIYDEHKLSTIYKY